MDFRSLTWPGGRGEVKLFFVLGKPVHLQDHPRESDYARREVTTGLTMLLFPIGPGQA